ncbi:MAG: hypothetical protein OEW05_09240, partial [Candidatus Aminicenantes bacterium]|nr:hypothetical protein [Candidatus Aminicenantes bacterium]
MKPSVWTIILALATVASGCGKAAKGPGTARFKDDLAFLKQHTQVVVLSDAAGKAQVAVNPDLQGRVMTTTADGPNG